MKKLVKEERPCKGCPWLRENQTPAAVAASPIDGRGEHWFSRSNIRRHWKAAGEIGAMLPCHETDANAPKYGGKAVSCDTPRICVGLTIAARKEVRAFMQAGTSFDRYEALGGLRFKAVALAAWASRLYYAGCTFGMGGRTFRMPRVGDDTRVGLPWKDSVQDVEAK